jgi:hypothetical protein
MIEKEKRKKEIKCRNAAGGCQLKPATQREEKVWLAPVHGVDVTVTRPIGPSRSAPTQSQRHLSTNVMTTAMTAMEPFIHIAFLLVFPTPISHASSWHTGRASHAKHLLRAQFWHTRLAWPSRLVERRLRRHRRSSDRGDRNSCSTTTKSCNGLWQFVYTLCLLCCQPCAHQYL